MISHLASQGHYVPGMYEVMMEGGKNFPVLFFLSVLATAILMSIFFLGKKKND